MAKTNTAKDIFDDYDFSKWSGVGYTTYGFKDCHKGPFELIPGLWLGSKKEGHNALESGKAIVAVPLDDMYGSVWDKWDGDVVYIPITDFGVLPIAIAKKKAQQLVDIYHQGKTMSVFCIGGHGRTGYVVSLMLGLLGYEDPIKFVRENYCEKAVESAAQVNQIAEILGKPELKKHAASKAYTWTNTIHKSNTKAATYTKTGAYCRDCVDWELRPMESKGYCLRYHRQEPGYANACASAKTVASVKVDSKPGPKQCGDCENFSSTVQVYHSSTDVKGDGGYCEVYKGFTFGDDIACTCYSELSKVTTPAEKEEKEIDKPN